MAQKLIFAGAALLYMTLSCAYSAPQDVPKVRSLNVDVDLVLLNATVTDSVRNRIVNGLEKKDFQVWEDKVEQKITTFSSEDVPVSVGIIFDVSGSMKDKIASAQRAASTFFRSGTRDDEYFVVQFADRPHIASDFTTDITRLQNRLLTISTKGNTALYDAVYLGLNKLKEGHNTKKALLLITDGEDNQSRYSYSNVRDFLREQNVQLYAIGILDPLGSGREALVQLADITGGRAFFPNAAYEMSDICKRIATELKHQYVLGYRSTNTAKDGAWRKIRVKVTNPRSKEVAGLDVQFRKGYYAQSGEEAPTRKK